MPALSILVPQWVKARRAASRMIQDNILDSVTQGTSLSLADIEAAEHLFTKWQVEWMRQQAIFARANEILSEDEIPQTPEVEASGKAGATSEEWKHQFTDAAGGVSDDFLRELFAQILAREARKPGSCSLKTLAVVRHTDKETAEKFHRVLPFLALGALPREGNSPLPRELKLHDVIEMDDADLMFSDGERSQVANGGRRILELGEHFVELWPRENIPIPMYGLRLAGRELASVLTTKTPPDYGHVVAGFLARLSSRPRVRITRRDQAPSGSHWMDRADWSVVQG